MTRSMALALYLATRPRGGAVELPDRPAGSSVLLCLRTPEDLAAGLVLARRLALPDRSGSGPTAVLICPPALALPDSDLAPNVIRHDLPDGSPATARNLLDHWRPGAVVVLGTDLPPALIVEAKARGIPLSLVNVAGPLVPDRGWRRFGGMVRSLLKGFRRIVVRDEATGRSLRRAGVAVSRIEIGGPMADAPDPLPHNEAEREALAQLLRGRPVWLAAGVPESEETLILAAHRQALRYSHRLLLIIVPENPARAEALQHLMASGASVVAAGGGTEVPALSVARRSCDEDAEEDVQVYLADTEGEMGLWYRLAPVTYLGGTLRGPEPRRHPLEAPTLGSVLLHGPVRGRYGQAMARLVAAGASYPLARSEDIPAALGVLLEPEQTARRAHAGWNTITAGAEITDRIADLVLADMHDATGGPRSASAKGGLRQSS